VFGHENPDYENIGQLKIVSFSLSLNLLWFWFKYSLLINNKFAKKIGDGKYIKYASNLVTNEGEEFFFSL
jgi:hypothetical protein